MSLGVWDAIADWGLCVFSGDTCQIPGLVIFSFMSNLLGLPPPRGSAAVLVLDGKYGNGHGNVVRSAVIVLNRSEWVSARGCERASHGTF
jgi:hypothetical protein